MAICPIICSFYYLALMHDVTCEFACAEGCPETFRANVLKVPQVCPQFSVMTTFSHLCVVIDGIVFFPISFNHDETLDFPSYCV